MASKLKRLTASGAITDPGAVKSIVLTPDGTNAGTVVVKEGGSSGTALMTLRCLGTVSTVWTAADPKGVWIDDAYATLTGTGIEVTFEIEEG